MEIASPRAVATAMNCRAQITEATNPAAIPEATQTASRFVMPPLWGPKRPGQALTLFKLTHYREFHPPVVELGGGYRRLIL